MSTTTNWNGSWLQSSFCKGEGFTVYGTVVETRVHSVFLSKNTSNPAELSEQLPTRFTVLVVEVKNAFRRLRVGDREVEPGKPLTIKGKKDPEPEAVPLDKLANAISGGAGSALPNGFLDNRRDKLFPKSKLFEFYCDVEKPAFKGIVLTEDLAIKTLGDSVIVESINRLNAKEKIFKNAEHAELGAGWAGKVMAQAEDPKKDDEIDKRQGADDDEWDD
eukprot:TRINITY_DN834_c0_g1_i2.p1 TRINITY_DN834_c0_g1~~TRINITY_DN834_c0_g1_i2.p1  ORF type:complete len:219 (+),score=73.20 TRINITY_DN834_c0_g1_i2:60-716(+)